ncbi:acetylxylan esterase [Mucilaginibacter sp. CAU 1740]|uniref:acetylxylan esterase n=1 Tax=Mucilaginibacter sp. CAU 1740 TaxID=3140365 RepID=UPI00325BC1A0
MNVIKSPKALLVGAALLCTGMLHAAVKPILHKVANDEEVSTTLTPRSKDALFSNNASYTFDVKNTYNTVQEGKVSYRVTTPTGVLVAKDSVKVKISARGSNSYNFNIPAMKPGFYKINFMINVSDYDDTTRRVFGIRPQEIRSNHSRPADFDAFWQTAKDQLAAVKPDFKMTEKPEMEKDNRLAYLIEMRSLDNIVIRGWLTIPKAGPKGRKFSVLVGLPGYQVNLMPMFGPDEDIAVITLNVRGQGNSRDVIHTKREDYITLNVEDKNKYVMRGAIMDCIRVIDFIYSRPELDHNRIEISGGSMGGYLVAALASLDSRINIASAQNPILGDIRNLVGSAEWPIYDFKKYASEKPGLSFDKILDNLDYYDIKNFAPNIKAPILVGVGLLDHLAPPNNEFAFYNNIPAKNKKIMVFKDLGHEVPMDYVMQEGHWMRDTFGLF